MRKELGIPVNATVWLSVGEVNTNKNHKVVIQALPDFSDTWYVLCGRGPLIDAYKKYAENLGVAERVIMAGYRTNVVDFYNMADVFVFPSFREGLPVALMEAMAVELPCVASRNRGTDDLLSGSRLLFSANDVNELKEKLRTVMFSDCTEEINRNKDHLKAFDLNNTLDLVKSFYMRAAYRFPGEEENEKTVIHS